MAKMKEAPERKVLNLQLRRNRANYGTRMLDLLTSTVASTLKMALQSTFRM
jgi:phage baseplate assembly protein W